MCSKKTKKKEQAIIKKQGTYFLIPFIFFFFPIKVRYFPLKKLVRFFGNSSSMARTGKYHCSSYNNRHPMNLLYYDTIFKWIKPWNQPGPLIAQTAIDRGTKEGFCMVVGLDIISTCDFNWIFDTQSRFLLCSPDFIHMQPLLVVTFCCVVLSVFIFSCRCRALGAWYSHAKWWFAFQPYYHSEKNT